LATPNYGYEKRQKELAKKRKKEDKLKQFGPGEGEASGTEDAPQEGGHNAAPPATPTP
jgi:hypothetical protein